MSLELVASDGCSTVLPLSAPNHQIRVQTIRIMQGSTMVELTTTDQANCSTSFDVPPQQQQDPVPPLSSSRDATAAISFPQEITPSPQLQPQATGASAARAAQNIGAASATYASPPTKKQPPRVPQEGAENEDKQEKWMREMRGWLLVVATVFAAMTYQAGLSPPGGFWLDDHPPSQPSWKATCITNVTAPCSRNTTLVSITSRGMASPCNETRHEAGHAILQDKNRRRYNLFFWTNSAAFVYSMGSIVFLLSDTLSSRLDQSDLKSVLLINVFIILGAYSAGCSRDSSGSIFPLSAMAVFIVSSAADIIIRKKNGRRNSKEKRCNQMCGRQQNVEALAAGQQ